MARQISWTYYQRGRRLRKYLVRWQYIGGRSLVWYGIMRNYINKVRAMVYFRQHKKYTEYRGSPKLQEIYDKKFQDLIKTGTVEETTWRKLLWINPSHLVPKANGDMRLVIDMRKVNQFMKPIKFKMEGVTTLK
jgi:hypothetical protein